VKYTIRPVFCPAEAEKEFRMHERTQRAVARLMFVFCCALPTAATCLAILLTWTPWYHRWSLAAIEAEWSDQTGLVVAIEDFRREAPSTIQLSGVRLSSPETGREVVSVRRVTLAWRDGEFVLVMRHPELQSAELGNAWRAVHDRFLCRPDQTAAPVQLLASDFTIHSRTGPLTLRDVNGFVTPQARATLANLTCVAASSAEATPIKINLRRDRRGPQPTTNWTFETGGTPLPCSALAECFPMMKSLGPDAMFRGLIAYQQPAGRKATLDLSTSRFEQVELSRLFEKLPYKLSGVAELHLDRCLIEVDGPAVDVTGTFRATDGLVGDALIESSRTHLGFALPEASASAAATRDLAYDQIALHFKLHGESLELTGVCHQETAYRGFPRGTVLCGGGQPLVRSSEQVLPAVQLLRLLSPSHSLMVPISEQTSVLSKLLKPPSRPLPTGTPTSMPRVTSAEPYSGGQPIKQR
jgi:hypothetical protein